MATNKESQIFKIFNDEDYIHCPKMKNSVTEFCNKHSDGVEDDYIARVLLITPQQVDQYYNSAVRKLRTIMNVG